MEERSISQSIACTFFPTYIFMIIVFTVFIRLPNNEYTAYLMPLWSYREIINSRDMALLFENIGNILIFVPVGIMLPMCGYRQKSNLKFTLVFGVCFTVFVEFFQFVTRVGTFETDDIINNFVGVFIGCAFITAIRKILECIKNRGD